MRFRVLSWRENMRDEFSATLQIEGDGQKLKVECHPAHEAAKLIRQAHEADIWVDWSLSGPASMP